MWLEDEQLRDVVIIDPVAYFVTPATVIISKLTPTKEDSTVHETEIHRNARKFQREEYDRLVSAGVLADSLIPLLLKQYKDRIPKIVRLMVKYGLLVPIIKNKFSTTNTNSTIYTLYFHFTCLMLSSESFILESVEEYIAPALLPEVDPSSSIFGNDITVCMFK